jgi:hypothetical protein
MKLKPAPESLNIIDLIRKIGNATVASMRKDIAEGKLPAGKEKAPKPKKS